MRCVETDNESWHFETVADPDDPALFYNGAVLAAVKHAARDALE